MIKINIAKDFSPYPGGRYPEDGAHSGQELRDNILIPALALSDQVAIELDGTRGYGSSFLEETFGGLVRNCYQPNKLLEKIIFVTNKNYLVDEILGYIQEADTNARNGSADCTD